MEPKYTMLFKEWLKVNTTEEPNPPVTIKDLIKTSFDNKYDNVDADTLIAMLESVYNFYEIGDSDNETMLTFLNDTFNEYGEYYSEIITNYSKEYDYALNNKRVVTKNDKLNIAGNTNITNNENRESIDYELPNKVIAESNYRSTPSGINDNNAVNEQDKNYENETTRESTNTTEFNNEFIDLKNKYMRQIRNVYHEFAMKFKECFYQVY